MDKDTLSLGVVMEHDLSDVSLSEASWADARADTPTLGKNNQSDSEDTLSSLSFDENGVLSPSSDPDKSPISFHGNNQMIEIKQQPSQFQPPIPAPRMSLIKNNLVESNVIPQINICGSDSSSYSLELDLPSATNYKPPTVDYPSSPSQLEKILGPSYLQKEESGGIQSEDDVSFASSCRAKLDLNFKNGGVKLTKKEINDSDDNIDFNKLQSINPIESEPNSILSCDQLEDYIEDYFLPNTNESVMQRHPSFRRNLNQQLQQNQTESSSIRELTKLNKMLSTYEEENYEEIQRNNHNQVNFKFNEYDETEPPQSILDIDKICEKHGPNLSKLNLDSPESIISLKGNEESVYYIPDTTIQKLYSVYESSNFNNIYTLSGELRHILTPIEIQEIIDNRNQLEGVINPNVMAALSWSMNPESLPPSYNIHNSISSINHNSKHNPSSSISNGYHSREGSDDEGSTKNESITGSGIDTPDSGASFSRGSTQTASFRRRIALGKSITAEIQALPTYLGNSEEDFNSISLSPSPKPNLQSEIISNIQSKSQSLENINNQFEEDGNINNENLYFVRKDSKRFSHKKEDRIVEGLFVESSGICGNGTLRRLKAPIIDDMDLSNSNENEDDINTGKVIPKKRIPLDESILCTGSISSLNDDESQRTDVDITFSETVFHSCFSKTQVDDGTIGNCSLSDDEEDITLDLDTPDDMQDSILGRLDEYEGVNPKVIPPTTAAEEEEEEDVSLEQWKSFSVGSKEIQIDLRAIQSYRRVLSHGGYFDAEQKIGIILFCGCYLPDRSRKEYSYLMDHLFLYVLSSLEELIVDDYILVYLHGATPKSAQPSFGWLKKCYQLIDHKLRKNLKGLYLVHPSFWLRTVVSICRPFISSKFSEKIEFIKTLSELCLELPTEHLVIPDPVLQYDFDMKVNFLKRQRQLL